MRATTVTETVPAQDIARATAFYEQTLGFTPAGRGPDGTRIYETADGSRFMVHPSEFAGTGRHTVAGLMVDDLAATMAELRDRGVVFDEYALRQAQEGPQGPGGEGLTTRDGVVEYGDMKTAWFVDTEGNTISIGETPADWATRDWTAP